MSCWCLTICWKLAGRFGSACRSWLLGPHVGVQQDLNGLKASFSSHRSLSRSRLPQEPEPRSPSQVTRVIAHVVKP